MRVYHNYRTNTQPHFFTICIAVWLVALQLLLPLPLAAGGGGSEGDGDSGGDADSSSDAAGGGGFSGGSGSDTVGSGSVGGDGLGGGGQIGGTAGSPGPAEASGGAYGGGGAAAAATGDQGIGGISGEGEFSGGSGSGTVGSGGFSGGSGSDTVGSGSVGGDGLGGTGSGNSDTDGSGASTGIGQSGGMTTRGAGGITETNNAFSGDSPSITTDLSDISSVTAALAENTRSYDAEPAPSTIATPDTLGEVPESITEAARGVVTESGISTPATTPTLDSVAFGDIPDTFSGPETTAGLLGVNGPVEMSFDEEAYEENVRTVETQTIDVPENPLSISGVTVSEVPSGLTVDPQTGQLVGGVPNQPTTIDPTETPERQITFDPYNIPEERAVIAPATLTELADDLQSQFETTAQTPNIGRDPITDKIGLTYDAFGAPVTVSFKTDTVFDEFYNEFNPFARARVLTELPAELAKRDIEGIEITDISREPGEAFYSAISGHAFNPDRVEAGFLDGYAITVDISVDEFTDEEAANVIDALGAVGVKGIDYTGMGSAAHIDATFDVGVERGYGPIDYHGGESAVDGAAIDAAEAQAVAGRGVGITTPGARPDRDATQNTSLAEQEEDVSITGTEDDATLGFDPEDGFSGQTPTETEEDEDTLAETPAGIQEAAQAELGSRFDEAFNAVEEAAERRDETLDESDLYAAAAREMQERALAEHDITELPEATTNPVVDFAATQAALYAGDQLVEDDDPRSVVTAKYAQSLADHGLYGASRAHMDAAKFQAAVEGLNPDTISEINDTIAETNAVIGRYAVAVEDLSVINEEQQAVLSQIVEDETVPTAVALALGLSVPGFNVTERDVEIAAQVLAELPSQTRRNIARGVLTEQDVREIGLVLSTGINRAKARDISLAEAFLANKQFSVFVDGRLQDQFQRHFDANRDNYVAVVESFLNGDLVDEFGIEETVPYSEISHYYNEELVDPDWAEAGKNLGRLPSGHRALSIQAEYPTIDQQVDPQEAFAAIYGGDMVTSPSQAFASPQFAGRNENFSLTGTDGQTPVAEQGPRGGGGSSRGNTGNQEQDGSSDVVAESGGGGNADNNNNADGQGNAVGTETGATPPVVSTSTTRGGSGLLQRVREFLNSLLQGDANEAAVAASVRAQDTAEARNAYTPPTLCQPQSIAQTAHTPVVTAAPSWWERIWRFVLQLFGADSQPTQYTQLPTTIGQGYIPVCVIIDETTGAVSFFRADREFPAPANPRRAALQLGADGQVIYSDGTYAPATNATPSVQDEADYVYIVERMRNGELVTAEVNNAAVPQNTFKNLRQRIFGGGAPFSLDDVASVTYEYVAAGEPGTADDYHEYEITLQNGDTRGAAVPVTTSLDFYRQQFARIGYNGDVLQLTADATRTGTRRTSDRTPGFIERILNRFSGQPQSNEGTDTQFADIANLGDDTAPLLTVSEAGTGRVTTEPTPATLTAENSGFTPRGIARVDVLLNVPVACRDGVNRLGFVYKAEVRGTDAQNVSTTTSVQNTICVTGSAADYAQVIANDLQVQLRTSPIDATALLEYIVFDYITLNVLDDVRDFANIPDGAGRAEENDIQFEARVTDARGRVLRDWSTADVQVNVTAGESLDFRWEAPNYDRCFPFIADNGEYSLFAGNDLQLTSGNTATVGYDVQEISGTYRIECGRGAGATLEVDQQSINVEVR